MTHFVFSPSAGRRGRATALGALAVLLAAAANAQTAPTAQAVPPPTVAVSPAEARPPVTVVLPRRAVGQATHELLDLQRQGRMASNLQYAMPYPVAQKVYERYVNSFGHPIPERSDSTMDGGRP